ncbi:MAG: HipA domain-containing protein [Chlamydiales bacterium]
MKEQIQLAAEYASKLSIQGVQPKLSVVLNAAEEQFEVVEKGGQYIFKPPNPNFDELPQNEDLTMRLAAMVNIPVPLHGMIYNIDNTLTYFIKRFDRAGRNKKIAVEDFSQLLGFRRETKYESSMEQLISVIEKHCTFPVIEKLKLFRLVIFNFLVGNEDMHLKNFTLIRDRDKVALSPAYDLVNSSIVLATREEIALPIRGEKNKLNRNDLIDYFGLQRLKLDEKVVQNEMKRFAASLEKWDCMIQQSFLSQQARHRYAKLIQNRWQRVNIRS